MSLSHLIYNNELVTQSGLTLKKSLSLWVILLLPKLLLTFPSLLNYTQPVSLIIPV